MRRMLSSILVVVAVVACAKKDAPPADTALADTAMAPAAAPAMAPALTETDVTGTWKGTSKPVGSDSVVARWTQVCGAGACTGTSEGSKLTIHSTYTLAGDSAVGVSKSYSDPATKVKVIDTWVSRIHGDSATGTGAMKLASKPDSVVMRYQFAGARVR